MTADTTDVTEEMETTIRIAVSLRWGDAFDADIARQIAEQVGARIRRDCANVEGVAVAVTASIGWYYVLIVTGFVLFTVVVAGGPRIADIVHGYAAEATNTTIASAGGGIAVIVLVCISAVPELTSRHNNKVRKFSNASKF